MVSLVAKLPLPGVVREPWPLLWVQIGALALLTLMPALSTWLPHLLSRH